MRIPSFTIQNQRSIGLAVCDNVPRIMVIAGPNGTAKSTLLNALRTAPGGGPILYVGPHRADRFRLPHPGSNAGDRWLGRRHR
jgi:ABC-type hemin transport system ATPase subunit